LYAIHPKYKNFTEATTLLDIGFQYTTISYTINNELLAIRSINYGLNTIAKNIAEKTKSTPSKILEHILRFGFG
jgi:cell division ATPase FtsA